MCSQPRSPLTLRTGTCCRGFSSTGKNRPVRIGVVCPYSLGTPGGVQNHVRDLAEELLDRGHDVSVLAPVEDGEAPPYVVSAGRAVGVPYNGSVARVTFGPRTAARVRTWLHDGNFDVVHVHEPTTPSASLLTLWAGDGPFVATFHTWQVRSRAMSAAAGLLRPALEKIDARIAVSENRSEEHTSELQSLRHLVCRLL